MADRISRATRSALMSRVKQRGTAPEIAIRSLLHQEGYRFRLFCDGLPGKPDIIFPGRKKVIFVHGCFWHGHDCTRGKRPTSNKRFWNKKISGNQARDKRVVQELSALGWSSFVVWECETRMVEIVKGELAKFLEARNDADISGLITK